MRITYKIYFKNKLYNTIHLYSNYRRQFRPYV